jgi:ferric iron reductase protein FhuF
MSKTKFDPKSPGFIASITYAILAAFAATGIEFPKDPAQIAGDFETTMSSGGIFAITGMLISAIIFPIWNFIKKGGKIDARLILSNTTFWVSLVTAILGFAALYGFTVPDGTAEQIVSAMYAKDWGVLLSVLALNILNPLIRFLKELKDIEPVEG